VYSLAVLVISIVRGAVPVDLARREGLSEALSAIILRCIAADLANRPAAQQLVDELAAGHDRVLAGTDVAALAEYEAKVMQ
jgi:hypothetical protein